MKYRIMLSLILVGLLAFLAACSVPGTGSTTPTSQATAPSTPTVYVTLLDTSLTSSVTSFTTGTTYHFVVTNDGHQPYTFAMMAQNREQEMEHMSMMDRQRAALHMIETIAPGQTVAFNYMFNSSMMGQPLEFACYQQGSNQIFMRLPFTMQP
jgi:uncharacterized cupredoxin-like copper-binding protein